MTEIFLSQTEADDLLALEKVIEENKEIDLPSSKGGSVDIRFVSRDKREKFVLNYARHSINLLKRNHHFRGRDVIGLARLDIDGPPHRNPDGEEIGPRHLHLYKAGYELKWAVEVPADKFTDLDNASQTLEDFMRFCNVVELPRIRMDLFS